MTRSQGWGDSIPSEKPAAKQKAATDQQQSVAGRSSCDSGHAPAKASRLVTSSCGVFSFFGILGADFFD